MEMLLSALRAVAEPTRLRLLALCAESEMTVSELTRILGQSQPFTSRHTDHLLDNIDTRDQFRHRMFNLQPGIDLEEPEVVSRD